MHVKKKKKRNMVMKNYKNWKLIERKANSEYKGTKEVSVGEAVETIKSLNDFNYNDPTWLWRGVDLEGDFYIIDPKPDRREWVVGTLATLIMEHHDSWKDYPSRLNSLFVVQGGEQSMGQYGKQYRVIPFDGAKFGVSPTANYKTSFDKIHNTLKTDANAFFYMLADVYNDITGGVFTVPEGEDKKNYCDSPENYDYLKLQINEMLEMSDSWATSKHNYWTNFDNADEFINYFFNAQDNNFQIMDYQELQEKLNPEQVDKYTDNMKEIWTDSTCLLVSEEWIPIKP